MIPYILLSREKFELNFEYSPKFARIELIRRFDRSPNLGYVNDPLHAIVASYATGSEPGALAQLYNAGQGHYNIVMTLITFVFLCGSLRISVPFVIVFFGLVFCFSFLAAGHYHLGYDPTVTGLEHAVYYFKIAGGFGLVSVITGWYLVSFQLESGCIRANFWQAIITVCTTTGVLCPLPIFDLSQRVLAHNTNAQKGEHAGNVTQG
jgi:hypothetical protein